jgi:hypothetical protein
MIGVSGTPMRSIIITSTRWIREETGICLSS